MSIQPSVLIWTVICFCAFAFVLNTFLFKPILKVLDSRREKIENAKQAAEKLQKEAQEEKRLKAEELQRQKTEQEEKQKALLEDFKEKSEQSLNDLRKENEKRLENKRLELKAAAEGNRAVISRNMDTFIAAFTEKLTSYR